MIFNDNYNRWISMSGVIFRYCKSKDKLVVCSTPVTNIGYSVVSVLCNGERKMKLVHRLVWETFNGEIPDGYEIDHIDGNKQNNALSNLRCVTHLENMSNPVTNVVMKNNGLKKSLKSEFGRKFYERFGFGRSQDSALYYNERKFWRKHRKCSWEVEA